MVVSGDFLVLATSLIRAAAVFGPALNSWCKHWLAMLKFMECNPAVQMMVRLNSNEVDIGPRWID